MNKALLSLAVAGLALSAAQASFAAPLTGNFNFNSFLNTATISRGSFNLQEAYRLQGTVDTTASTAVVQGTSIGVSGARNRGWCGTTQETSLHYPLTIPGTFSGDTSCLQSVYAPATANNGELVTAVPGVFALCSVNKGSGDFRQRLNVAAFAFCPPGFSTPTVQSVRLTKHIPVQRKCPFVFPDQTFIQFGGNIRTWWALLFTPPGTTFTLDVTVACQGIPSAGNAGKTAIAIDRYIWTVKVSTESLLAVVDLLHSNPVSTSEIPCIAAEDVYLALRIAIARIQCAPPTSVTDTSRQDRLFEAEALVIAFCAFGDCFIAEDFFGTFPPSNDVDMGGAFGPTGILDTIENPCCCKLLVDLDNLGIALTGGQGTLTTP